MMNPDAVKSDKQCEQFLRERHPIAMQFFDGVIGAFNDIYVNTGAPFGNNEEGFAVWLKVVEMTIPDYRR